MRAHIHGFESLFARVQLIREVTDAIAELDARRPLSEDVVRKLQTDILYDRVRSSAVTEGNRLSRRETIVVLTAGLIEAGKRKDELEVRNLAEAIIEVEEALRNQVPLSPHFVRQLHSLLLKDLDDEFAGVYRSEDVAIAGAKLRPPTFHDAAPLVQAVLDAAALSDKSIHPIQKAAWIHWALARIHPFRDGNGRIARLVQDYVLFKEGYVPAPLQIEDREGAYYTALESADLGDGRQLLELVAKNALRMADRYLAIIREEETKSLSVNPCRG